jgi:hypothetical protein
MVLNEPATRFYLFLEHAIKIEAENHYYQLQISQFPTLTEESQQKLLKQYENIINENDEIEPEIKIDYTEIINDREKLKLLLKGK